MKKKVSKEKKFFEDLAIEVGTCDLEIVKKIYYGLIRRTIRNLGNGGKLIYPDFGEFHIKRQKAKRMNHVITGEIINIDAVNTARFKPCVKFKEYLKGRS